MYQIDWGAKYRSRIKNRSFAIAILISLQISPSALFAQAQSTLLSQDDTPEEVLRSEIYTDARSPIDGKQLTATEYVELMEKLRSLDSIPPEDFVSPRVREVINLLRLRKLLRQFIPFIP